jgi:hypothetical protein
MIHDSNGLPLLGVVVVAVDASNPESNRVASMSYAGGLYAVSGLTPGSYYVYAETVDQDPLGANAPGYYFASADVPSYVDLTPTSTGCIGPPPAVPAIQTEFYNSPDVKMEPQSLASLLTVVAPNNYPAIDINTNRSTGMGGIPNILAGGQVSTGGGGPAYYSPRGIRLVLAGSAKSVQLSIQGGTPFAGGTYDIRFATARTMTMTGSGQLQQVTQGTGAGIPSQVSGTLGVTSGNALKNLSITTSSLYLTLYVQVQLTKGSTTAFSNVMVIWVAG